MIRDPKLPRLRKRTPFETRVEPLEPLAPLALLEPFVPHILVCCVLVATANRSMEFRVQGKFWESAASRCR